MPIQKDYIEIVEYLQRYLTNNKARGMVAEIALATFLARSGIGIIVSGGWLRLPHSDLHQLQWHHYVYRDERLHKAVDDEPFSKWPGNRGRASRGGEWTEDVLERFSQANDGELTSLLMRQAFFYGYLKEKLRNEEWLASHAQLDTSIRYQIQQMMNDTTLYL